jgi:hypothetical protein
MAWGVQKVKAKKRLTTVEIDGMNVIISRLSWLQFPAKYEKLIPHN